ncbi:MAG: VWA domain-containing protein [Ignavibacteria bacterium]|nr:VWA domain-containing protein [Ignavibacteria bacterium]
MNFLNPFALLGLVASGIPILLHLLNLRRLKVVEFSTIRFLQELQLSRVRRLKLQQILLLILRTLLIVFAVLAFARPTIPTSLPLLTSAMRASVVILVDNSASMEASDQAGQRFRQAQDAARRIVGMLRNGDEVCVLPLAARSPHRTFGFTRTFAEALAEIDRLTLSETNADVPGSLRFVEPLLDDAAHLHREVYVISDAQRATLMRVENDTGKVFYSESAVYLVRIGNGLAGLEQNFSIDSVKIVSQLNQPDKPLEVEAFVRNGSDRDVSNVVVTMAFDGVRNAQRAADIPANSTRSVVLAAPPQRNGIVGVSVELDDDAIDLDNVRFAGVLIPPHARTAIVGTGLAAELVATALAVPNESIDYPKPRRFNSVRELSSQLSGLDAVYIVNGAWSDADASQLIQFVDHGGGLVVFASDEACVASTLQRMNLNVDNTITPHGNDVWRVRNLDESHPLFAGVFKAGRTQAAVRERLVIRKLRPATGGVVVATSDAGSFLVETMHGYGRTLYIATAIDPAWSTMGSTGLFAATMIRSSIYLVLPRDQGIYAKPAETVTVQVPARFANEQSFIIVDANRVSTTQTPARLPSSTLITVPAQHQVGVVKILTSDSTAVVPVTVNGPKEESHLTFFDDDEWRQGVGALTANHNNIIVTKSGRSMEQAAMKARTGSELWSLFIVLSLLCAFTELLISRFFASDEGPAVGAA